MLQTEPGGHGERVRMDNGVSLVPSWHWAAATGLTLAAALLVACGGGGSDSGEVSSSGREPIVEIVAEAFVHPWGITFLPGPGNRALVTERPGQLNLVDLDSATAQRVGGIPAVAAVGQGGLLDVALYPDFGPGQEWVYLSYAAAGEDRELYATHVGRGRLVEESEGPRLVDFEVLHVATPYASTNVHFGSRLAFDSRWRLYITAGDRGHRDSGQDLRSHWGKTLRLERDGTIPEDNPFRKNPDALDAIFSYGHRNVQGMAVEPGTGLIWQAEHGQHHGDEINIIDPPGGNFGWPVATHATEYGSDEPVGVLPSERPDTVPPVHYWDDTRYADGQQGFPPSGLAFYDGEAFPEWRGNLLIGTLAHEYLARFELAGRGIVGEHRLLHGRGWRIRDVAVHPRSGHIYVLVDSPNAPIVRIRPDR